MNTPSVLFTFDCTEIRVIFLPEPWFSANDVCAALGFTNPHKAVADHVDAEDLTKRYTLTEGGKQKANFINESVLEPSCHPSAKPAPTPCQRSPRYC